LERGSVLHALECVRMHWILWMLAQHSLRSVYRVIYGGFVFIWVGH